MRPRLDRVLLVFIALILLAQSLAVGLYWYDIDPRIDIAFHILGGAWIGLLFIYLYFERLSLLPRNLGFFALLFLITGFVALIGVGWEVFEYFSRVFVTGDISFGGSVSGLHFDTLKDVFNDTLGGALVAIWYWYRSRQTKSL